MRERLRCNVGDQAVMPPVIHPPVLHLLLASLRQRGHKLKVRETIGGCPGFTFWHISPPFWIVRIKDIPANCARKRGAHVPPFQEKAGKLRIRGRSGESFLYRQGRVIGIELATPNRLMLVSIACCCTIMLRTASPGP